MPQLRRRHPADRVHARNQGRSGRFSHTSANRSSRLPSLPLVARPPTGARSCRSMTTATSFNPRPTSCPRSTSTASDPSWARGINEAATRPDSKRFCADGRKTPLQGVSQAFLDPLFRDKEDRALSSRAAHQLAIGYGCAIGRAILSNQPRHPHGMRETDTTNHSHFRPPRAAVFNRRHHQRP